ncbi:type II toxin-antitoxin system VapC family toxin [Rhodopila sp.]|uniref:type II toxin-antitoxin system VapC family toxin n=1 Tax=Rhodopila sp. TaxID=2480087 RepID=UPI003D133596
MLFVLDASVAAVWGLEDEDDTIADLAWARLEMGGAVTPAIWWFEVRNVLLVNERRGSISERDGAIFLRALARMNVEVDHAPAGDVVLSLARRHRLTVYDSTYLELALRRDLPLATLDKQLAAAARREAVRLIG